MKHLTSKTMILITVILMDILGGAEVDLFIPSFPELQAQFDLSPFWVEALLSVNFIGFCMSLFFVGGLADRHGRKPIIVGGLLIFTLGSALCLWATVYPMLLIGRFLQGLGISAPTTLCFLIISDLYPIKKQQVYMAILNGLANFSVAVAPILGSFITLIYHWQGNFWFLFGLGLLVLIMSLVFIPQNKLPKTKESLSLRGYIPIFKSPPLMLMIIFSIFGSATYWVFIGMSPLLYIEDLGVSLAHFGYYQGSLAFIYGAGCILSGLLVHKLNHKKMLVISACLGAFGVLSILAVALMDSRNPLIITLSMIPYDLACVLPFTILYPLCLAYMPKAKGKVSAIVHGARLIFTSFGLQLAGYLYTGSFQTIGVIVAAFFMMAVIALFLIIKNWNKMNFEKALSEQEPHPH